MKMGKLKTRTTWNDTEHATVINLYFSMLAMQEKGQKFTKAPLVRLAMETTGKTRGSIETKLMNISALQLENEREIVKGYKALPNYGKSLKDAYSAVFEALNVQSNVA